MISITSTELNYIVFRYLHESGFTHSAFALGYEAGINKSTIDGNLVPPGALVTFVQKGIQYLELEANLSCSDADIDGDFSFIQPLDLITKDVYELQKIIKEKKESLQQDRHREKEKDKNEFDQEQEREHAREREKEKQQKEKERERDREKIEKDKEREKDKDEEKRTEDSVDTKPGGDKVSTKHEENGNGGGPEPMDICTSSTSLPSEIPSCDVTVLEGHTSEVFACAWSPAGSLLASGSGDSTARIWTVGDGPCSSSMPNGPLNVVVLKHYKGRINEKSKDVTTLDWNAEGTLLATGSYDGQARIWNRDGELMTTLNKHKGPIFSLKWNKKGDYIVSGSVDKTAIVWDIKTGEWKQQFEFHSAPTLDVDWRNNVSFATCSTDHMIFVCKVGENRPIKTFSGHQGEVNAIKWDPTGSLLASCSDDSTAKIWSMKQDTYLHDLKEHTKEIYTIRWSPTGPGTNNPNQQLVLASIIRRSCGLVGTIYFSLEVHSSIFRAYTSSILRAYTLSTLCANFFVRAWSGRVNSNRYWVKQLTGLTVGLSSFCKRGRFSRQNGFEVYPDQTLDWSTGQQLNWPLRSSPVLKTLPRTPMSALASQICNQSCVFTKPSFRPQALDIMVDSGAAA